VPFASDAAEGRRDTAANLDAEIWQCIECLAAHGFEDAISRVRSGATVRSWAIPPFRI
jgi:hypothetical protein